MVEKLYVTYNQVCTRAILEMHSSMRTRLRYVPRRTFALYFHSYRET